MPLRTLPAKLSLPLLASYDECYLMPAKSKSTKGIAFRDMRRCCEPTQRVNQARHHDEAEVAYAFVQ